MSISVYPEIQSSSGLLIVGLTAAASDRLYQASVEMSEGIYDITCPSGTITNVELFNSNTLVMSATTSSGVVSVSLSEPVNRIDFWINTGTNVAILVKQTAARGIFSEFSGTLDTITSSGTYNQTGPVVLAIVGGGAGGASNGGSSYPGRGGGGGGLRTVRTTLNTSTSVTIGSGGNGGNPGNAGGTTTFGNFSANGGEGGARSNSQSDGSTTSGGSPGNAYGGSSMGNVGGNNNNPYRWIGVTNNQGGAGGRGGYSNTGADVNPIGVGGSYNSANGSGYGSGGCGGPAQNSGVPGGNGTPGVVYVLRGF